MNEKKRLSVDLDRDMHRDIKTIAALKNITISVWVELALRKELKKEQELGFKISSE